MRILLRLVLVILAASLPVAAVAFPAWLAAGGWSGRQLEAESRRGEELDACHAAVCRRLQERCAVLDAVIAGRLTLAEAAARCRDLDGDLPADLVARALPGRPADPEDLRLRLRVLDQVAKHLRDRPDRDAVLGRLHLELQGDPGP